MSAGANQASLAAASGLLRLALYASGPCWIELRGGSVNGPVLYEGTVAPGATEVFDTAGGAWLRLGNPAGVRLSVDGVAIALPSVPIPFDVVVTAAGRPTGA